MHLPGCAQLVHVHARTSHARFSLTSGYVRMYMGRCGLISAAAMRRIMWIRPMAGASGLAANLTEDVLFSANLSYENRGVGQIQWLRIWASWHLAHGSIIIRAEPGDRAAHHI